MKKKKKPSFQENFSNPDTNPERNTDLEIKKEHHWKKEDLDIIRDDERQPDIINDDLSTEAEDDI